MASLVRRCMTLMVCVMLVGLWPGEGVRAASPPALSQGWRVARMLGAPVASGVWLLPAGNRLVAMNVETGYGPQNTPAEWISADGRTWEPLSIPAGVFGKNIIHAMASGPAGLVAVGQVAPPPFTRDSTWQPAAWFSRDGRTWHRATPIGNAFAAGIMQTVTAYGKGFVAAGYTAYAASPPISRMTVWTSADGVHWRRLPNDAPAFKNATSTGILRAGQGLVVVGSSRPVNAPPAPIVWTSPNGLAWHRVPRAGLVFPAGKDVQLEGAVRGQSRYVAWGLAFGQRPPLLPRTLVWVSADGLHWNLAPGIHFQYGVLNAVNGIAPHAGGFVALGVRDSEPTLWSSPDGARWAPAVGEDVFGGGYTQVAGAIDWQGKLVVLGSYDPPVSAVPLAGVTAPAPIPTVWLQQPGRPNQTHPNWPRTDPKWFRLRIEDLPAGFTVEDAVGADGGAISCSFPGDLEVVRPLQASPPSEINGPCMQAVSSLGRSTAYFFSFPYTRVANPNMPLLPFVQGEAILTADAAHAQAALAQGAGLVALVDLPEITSLPRRVRSLSIGQGGALYSFTTGQGATAYAAVWRDGRALGMVGVLRVPLDEQALAVALAKRERAHWHTLGY